MSTQPLQFTPSQVIGAETAQWKEIVRHALADLRCAAPAILTAPADGQPVFDAATQTVTAQIAVRERVRFPSGSRWMEVPPIMRVPYAAYRAGGFSMTIPPQAGDEGLLIFCDANIDAWWQNGGIQNQMEIRRHDLTDCFFVPGGWSQPRPLSNYSTDSMQLRSDDGKTIIDIGEAGITLTGEQIQVNASQQIQLDSPAIAAGNEGGTALPLMNDTFYQYWVNTVYPFLVSKGFVGGLPPVGSETTVLKGQ